jgi:hypothetical protein
MELTGAQQARLSEALLGAFPRVETLRRMVRFTLNRNLDDFTDGPLSDRVLQLIQEAEREGWTHALIHGALEDTPGHPRLKSFVQEYAFSIQREASGPKLERIIVETQTLLDPVRWRERLEVIERQVCRVELGGRAVGTGFLVAADVVLTNHHVVQEVLRGTVSPDFLVLRFDYKRLQDGTELQGRVYGLAQDWLLHASPHSSVDLMSPKPHEASTQELDYALLRVKGQPGHEPVEGQRTRKWLDVPAEAYAFPPGSPILIVQHPHGDRLRLAIADQYPGRLVRCSLLRPGLDAGGAPPQRGPGEPGAVQRGHSPLHHPRPRAGGGAPAARLELSLSPRRSAPAHACAAASRGACGPARPPGRRGRCCPWCGRAAG